MFSSRFLQKIGAKLLITLTITVLSVLAIQSVSIAQDPCTPNQNTFRDGITKEQCPDGTTAPTFNAYRDYGYQSGETFDERDFLKVGKFGEGFMEQVSVIPGDKLRFSAYLHNDCDPRLNNGGEGPCVAHNVKTFAQRFIEENGDFQTLPSTRHTVTQTFQANNTIPRQVTDDALVVSANNQDVVLEYIPGTAGYFNVNDKDRFYHLNARPFFGNGAELTSVNREGIKAEAGDFFGSAEYIVYVEFDVIVKRPEKPVVPPDKVCVDLRIIDVVNNADGTITFGWETTPGNYADDAQLQVIQGPGRLEMVGNNRARLIGGNNKTLVSVFVPGSEKCKAILEVNFPDVEQPCLDLELVPDRFNPFESKHTFRVETNPNDYNDLQWKLIGDNSDVSVIITDNNRSATFTNLNPDNVVRVFATGEVAPGHKCEDEARSQLPPPTEYCLEANLRPNHFPADGGRREFIFEFFPSEYEGDFIWRTEPAGVGLFADGEQIGNPITSNARRVVYRGGKPGTIVIVEAKDPAFRADCSDRAIARDDVKPDESDNLIKTADVAVANPGDIITYNITYKKDPFFQTETNNVTIFDTIGKEGAITGSRGGKIEPITDSMNINLPRCGGPASSNCYTGSIFSPDGVTLQNFTSNNPVTITYKAVMNTVIDAKFCENLTNEFCGETFENEAFDTQNHLSKWTVTVLCPAFRSFGFGDIFLEDNFKSGIDTYKCNGKPNVQSVVVTPKVPDDQGIIKVGNEELTLPEHGECKKNDIFPNLSSELCELESQLSDEFTNNPLRTLTRNAQLVCTNAVIHNSVTLSSGSVAELRRYANPNNTNELIICANNIQTTGPLTIDYDGPVTLVAKQSLTINGDILYSNNTQITPALVAVTNGQITTNNTKKLSGIYIALPNSDNTISPMVINNDSSRAGAAFEVVGSLIGTSFEVQNNDFNIIYDLGRFLITEPSVLNDALDFIQEVTVN